LTCRVVGILDEDVEHLRSGEVLAETVRSCPLDATTGCGDEAFYGGGVKPAGKFLLLRLYSRDNGDRKKILEDAAV
jgi:hypothetical protein